MRGQRSNAFFPRVMTATSDSSVEPSDLEGSNLYSSEELQEALKKVSENIVSHVGGSRELPSPGLRVAQLYEQLAFPLTTHQAEQLAKHANTCPHGRGHDTVVDTAVRDCLQVEPSNITFTNPKWQPAVDLLVHQVTEAFGLPTISVKASFYKLLLYRKGGHFKPHRDTEKESGMFATLSIQLPSHFRGGEFVLTHKDKPAIYHNGTTDGTCAFEPHYNAFFADVQHEIRPVTEGYRVALVYNLSWIGEGTPPSASCDMIDVETALRDYAQLAPAGAWTLVLGLEHKYTKASLSRLGIRALKGADRRSIASIKAASHQIGEGDVNIVVCKLGIKVFESGDVWDQRFHRADSHNGDIFADAKFDADGKAVKRDLNFITWEYAGSDLKFELKNKGDVEITGNEGATRETTYSAYAVVIWPKNKDLELRCTSTEAITSLLRGAPKHITHERINRILRYYETVSEASPHRP